MLCEAAPPAPRAVLLGECQKTISIPILDNGRYELEESVMLTLLNPQVCSISVAIPSPSRSSLLHSTSPRAPPPDVIWIEICTGFAGRELSASPHCHLLSLPA